MISIGKIVTHDWSVPEPPHEEHRPFGFEQIADCGSMRVVGLRLEPGQNVPGPRNSLPRPLIVTPGRLHFDDGLKSGGPRAREMLVDNPGVPHPYHTALHTS